MYRHLGAIYMKIASQHLLPVESYQPICACLFYQMDLVLDLFKLKPLENEVTQN